MTSKQDTTPPILFAWTSVVCRRSGMNSDIRSDYGVLTAATADEARGAALRIVQAKWPAHSVEVLDAHEVPRHLIEEAGYAKQP